MSIISSIKKVAKKVIDTGSKAISTVKNAVTPVANKVASTASNVAKGVASGASKAYSTVDKKIGGVLPGGYVAPKATPAPVNKTSSSDKPSNIVTKAVDTVKNLDASAGKAISGNPEAQGLAGMAMDTLDSPFTKDIVTGKDKINPETGQPVQLNQGTVPISPAAGVSVMKGFVDARNLAAAESAAAKLGISTEMAAKLGTKISTTKQLANWLTPAKIAGLSVTAAGTLASVDTLTTWYALDNVIGGQKMYLQNMAKDLMYNPQNYNKADLLKDLEESQKNRQIAIDKVNLSASLNPLLWPTKKLILAGVESDQQAIDQLEQQITDLMGNLPEAPATKPDYKKTGLNDKQISHVEEMDDKINSFSEETRLAEQYKLDAQRTNRAEEAAYWAESQRLAIENEKKILEMREAYWARARKEIAKRNDENTRSQLSFGGF